MARKIGDIPEVGTLSLDEVRAWLERLVEEGRQDWGRNKWWNLYYSIVNDRLPIGLPQSLVAAALEINAGMQYRDLGSLHGLAPYHDEAVVMTLERLAKDKKIENHVHANFVLTSLRNAKRSTSSTRSKQSSDHRRLQDVIRVTLSLYGIGDSREPTAAYISKIIKERPEIVVGAQAAVALIKDGKHNTSKYLPILIADASDESLDVLLPWIEKVSRDDYQYDLSWFFEAIDTFTPQAKQPSRLMKLFEGAQLRRYLGEKKRKKKKTQ